MSTVFLDRDGVINEDSADFIKSWDEFKFLPSALEAIALLAKNGYRVVIVSNQSGLGRGLFTQAALDEIHRKMTAAIVAAGGRVDGLYYCPHTPEAACDCRKPKPGLFFEAARELGIELSTAWSIGDSYRDVEAANAAGIRSILLHRDLPDPFEPCDPSTYVRAATLMDAAQLVLRRDSDGARA